MLVIEQSRVLIDYLAFHIGKALDHAAVIH